MNNRNHNTYRKAYHRSYRTTRSALRWSVLGFTLLAFGLPFAQTTPGQAVIKNSAVKKTTQKENPNAPAVKKSNDIPIYDGTDSYTGMIGFRANGGWYNFESVYSNPAGGRDIFSLPTLSGINFAGGELSIRLGPDKNGFHNEEKGFSYYRSNHGMFADVEIGYKRFWYSPGCIMHNDLMYIYRYQPVGEEYVNQDNNQQNCSPDGRTNVGGNVDSNPNASLDGVSKEIRDSTQNIAANVNLFYLNSYYHMTWLNFLFNGFTSDFRWFDLSIGPSYRLANYSDYGDPERAMELDDDNSFATIAFVARLYMQFGPYVRVRTHFYYPFYAQVARLLFKSDNFNQDELTVDVGLDIMLLRSASVGLYFTIGFEYHDWIINQNSPDRFNRGRSGLIMQERTSSEIYIGLGAEGYLSQ